MSGWRKPSHPHRTIRSTGSTRNAPIRWEAMIMRTNFLRLFAMCSALILYSTFAYAGLVPISNVVTVKAGISYSLALKSDGTVWAWGDNSLGELGDGTTNNQTTPVQVVGSNGQGFLTGVKAIVAGNDNHNLALKQDGTVFAWGDNEWGQLGDGTNDTVF